MVKDIIFKIGSAGGPEFAANLKNIVNQIEAVGKKIAATVKEAERFMQVQRRVKLDLSEMNRETKGLIGTLESYVGANKLSEAGAEANAKQMAAVGKAAVSLARATGITATAAYERLTTSISKGSSRALKEIGIDIENTEDLVLAQAEAIDKITAKYGDMSVEIETAEERMFAFSNAVDTVKQNLVSGAFDNFQETFFQIGSGLSGANTSLEEFSNLLVETDGHLARAIMSMDGLANALETVAASVFGLTEISEDLAAERARMLHIAQNTAEFEKKMAEQSIANAKMVSEAEAAKQQSYIETARIQLEALGIGDTLTQQEQRANAAALDAINALEKKTFKPKSGRGRSAKKEKGIEQDIISESISDRVDYEMEMLAAIIDAEEKAEAEKLQRFAEMQEAYTQKVIAEAEQRAAAEQKLRQEAMAGTAKMFSDMSSLQASNNETMFNIGKASDIAQTAAATYHGAQESYNAFAGLPIVGPALGAAAAGAAIAAGAVRVNKIRQTTLRGSSGPSRTSSSGGSFSGAAANAGIMRQQSPEIVDRRPIQVIMDGRMITNQIIQDSVRRQQRGERGLVVRS